MTSEENVLPSSVMQACRGSCSFGSRGPATSQAATEFNLVHRVLNLQAFEIQELLDSGAGSKVSGGKMWGHSVQQGQSLCMSSRVGYSCSCKVKSKLPW